MVIEMVIGIVALALFGGAAVGFFVGKGKDNRARVQELEEALEGSQSELADYRSEVYGQFAETAEKFRALDKSYNELHRQLAESSVALCGDDATPLLAGPNTSLLTEDDSAEREEKEINPTAEAGASAEEATAADATDAADPTDAAIGDPEAPPQAEEKTEAAQNAEPTSAESVTAAQDQTDEEVEKTAAVESEATQDSTKTEDNTDDVSKTQTADTAATESTAADSPEADSPDAYSPDKKSIEDDNIVVGESTDVPVLTDVQKAEQQTNLEGEPNTAGADDAHDTEQPEKNRNLGG